MENKENLVAEVTENTETAAAEEIAVEYPKLYTEEELNAKVNEVSGKRAARKESKIRKQFERKYDGLMNVLRAGMGVETVEEAESKLTEFYRSKGIEMQPKAEYRAEDINTLAKADAEEIIRYGFDEVVEEVDRLAELGVENMTAREKAAYKLLAEHRANAERNNELASIGITEEVYNSKEFNEFAADFNPSTPIKKIYDLYNKTQPKKEIKTMGSMKNTASEDEIKDFYSPEEARRFTTKDFERNPKLYERVVESSHKWK